jgi:hypothetical protein
MISRRLFLELAGTAAVTHVVFPLRAMGESVPTTLDHILLGCSDLDKGITFVEEKTGVRAAFGGVHPGRGTQDALLSFGEHRYLEIIAPDPKQSGVQQFTAIANLVEPRLIGWAAHPGDLDSFAKKLHEASLAFEGPTPGSRKRPDGGLLQWKALRLKDDASGLLPFFIEWSANSLHPSTDAPSGCRIVRIEILTPDPDALAKTAKQLGLDFPIVKANNPQLRATIASPKSELVLTS